MAGNKKKNTSSQRYRGKNHLVNRGQVSNPTPHSHKRQRMIRWVAWTIISIMVISIVAGFFW